MGRGHPRRILPPLWVKKKEYQGRTISENRHPQAQVYEKKALAKTQEVRVSSPKRGNSVE